MIIVRLRERQFLCGLVFAFVLVALGIFSFGSSRSFFVHQIKESTQEVPPRYTELYFTRNVRLPLRTTERTPVLLSFVVAPHAWPNTGEVVGSVALASGSGTVHQIQGFTVLSRSAAQTFTVSFEAPADATPYTVTVALPSLKLSIYALGQSTPGAAHGE